MSHIVHSGVLGWTLIGAAVAAVLAGAWFTRRHWHTGPYQPSHAAQAAADDQWATTLHEWNAPWLPAPQPARVAPAMMPEPIAGDADHDMYLPAFPEVHDARRPQAADRMDEAGDRAGRGPSTVPESRAPRPGTVTVAAGRPGGRTASADHAGRSGGSQPGTADRGTAGGDARNRQHYLTGICPLDGDCHDQAPEPPTITGLPAVTDLDHDRRDSLRQFIAQVDQAAADDWDQLVKAVNHG